MSTIIDSLRSRIPELEKAHLRSETVKKLNAIQRLANDLGYKPIDEETQWDSIQEEISNVCEILRNGLRFVLAPEIDSTKPFKGCKSLQITPNYYRPNYFIKYREVKGHNRRAVTVSEHNFQFRKDLGTTYRIDISQLPGTDKAVYTDVSMITHSWNFGSFHIDSASGSKNSYYEDLFRILDIISSSLNELASQNNTKKAH